MDSTNVMEALSLLNVRVPTYLVPEAGNFSISCPFAPHDDGHKGKRDSRPSCSILVDPVKVSLFKCWTCDRKGSLVWMAVELSRLGVVPEQVVSKIESLEVAKLEKAGLKRVRNEKWKKQVEGIAWGQVPQYIVDRGVSLQVCREWNLGYDQKKSRVVFPVWNRWDELVGMVGRTMDPNASSKYPAYPGFAKEDHLYGAQLLKPGVSRKVILVEGMLDVLAAYSFRILSQYVTLGLMGVLLMDGQREILKSWADELILMLDDDEAGRNATDRILTDMSPILPVRVATYPTGKKDPKEMDREEFLTVAQNAKCPNFLW